MVVGEVYSRARYFTIHNARGRTGIVVRWKRKHDCGLYGILGSSGLKMHDYLPPSWILASRPPVMLATWSFRRACSVELHLLAKSHSTRHMRYGKMRERERERDKGATAFWWY